MSSNAHNYNFFSGQKWLEFRPVFMARWLPPLTFVQQMEVFDDLAQRPGEDVMTYGDRFERAFNKIVLGGATRTGSTEFQEGYDTAVDHLAKIKFVQGLTDSVR